MLQTKIRARRQRATQFAGQLVDAVTRKSASICLRGLTRRPCDGPRKAAPAKVWRPGRTKFGGRSLSLPPRTMGSAPAPGAGEAAPAEQSPSPLNHFRFYCLAASKPVTDRRSPGKVSGRGPGRLGASPFLRRLPQPAPRLESRLQPVRCGTSSSAGFGTAPVPCQKPRCAPAAFLMFGD